MVKRLSNILLAVCIIFAGCTIDYDDPSKEVAKSDTIPDSVMRNFKLIKIKDNKPYTEVSSSQAEIFNKKNTTVLQNVIFKEYSTTSGKIVTKGNADIVEYYNDSKNASLSGNLKFYSEKDKIEMFGEYLSWNDSDRILSSKSGSSIEVIKEDGSKIKGFGFYANLKNSTFSFEKNVTGITP